MSNPALTCQSFLLGFDMSETFLRFDMSELFVRL